MSTIQEQKNKWLTFEEICPEWSNHLAIIGGYDNLRVYHNTVFTGSNKKFYDLGDGGCCIVGEAWKGKKYYGIHGLGCGTCFHFSMNKFMFCVGNEALFEIIKQDFVKHFNEVHIK